MNVYCLYFPNGKRYIGVEGKTGKRIKSHKCSSRSKSKDPKRRQIVANALFKYGWENIQWRYVIQDVDEKTALAFEVMLIASNGLLNKKLGYNVSPENGQYKAGRKRPEESIRKSREKMTGYIWSPKALENMKIAAVKRRGMPVSEETRRRMSESAKKRKASEETRRKISEGNRGKTISAEQRAKISEAHMGKKKSPEHLAKIGQALKGRTAHNAGKKRVTLPDGTPAYVDKKKS
jgi:hypothetical protein